MGGGSAKSRSSLEQLIPLGVITLKSSITLASRFHKLLALAECYRWVLYSKLSLSFCYT